MEQGEVKLNVGCGEFYADGWTNMDVASNDLVRPDIIGSLTDLPKPDDLSNIEMVYLGHILEHLPYATIPSVLRGLWPRCVTNAKVAIVGPDVDRAAALHVGGQLDWRTVVLALTGEDRWLGDQHLWACNEDRLLRIVKSSGLKRVHPIPISSPLLDEFPVTSRAAWQCAIIGVVG